MKIVLIVVLFHLLLDKRSF